MDKGQKHIKKVKIELHKKCTTLDISYTTFLITHLSTVNLSVDDIGSTVQNTIDQPLS